MGRGRAGCDEHRRQRRPKVERRQPGVAAADLPGEGQAGQKEAVAKGEIDENRARFVGSGGATAKVVKRAQ